MEFEFEEKEQYTQEEVQAIVESLKSEVDNTIKTKDTELTELTTEVEKVKELETTNHQLSIKNLAIQNGIDEDLFDLVQDDDLKVVEKKIEKLKSIKKVDDIDRSYKPSQTQKRSEDQYEKAINNKDVESALKNKFGRLFG